jgi:hypothetical protein
MRRTWTGIWVGVLLNGLVGASLAQADVTGSYDGGLTIAAAAVFSQIDKAVTGTVALPSDLESFGGEYLVTGKATPKKLKVSGIGLGGVSFKYRGKITGETIRGKAKLKGPGGKLRAILAITLNVSTGDGSGCDAVYTANETFFRDQMLGQALTSCASCHNPGLQAGATRLHIDPSDPLATARQIALLIDAVSPSTSRILEKPLNAVPHGGGRQITSGSTQEQLLVQWADLVAAAACN